jgi:hypothetical protein
VKKTKNPQGPVQNPDPDPGFYRKYLFVNNAIYVLSKGRIKTSMKNFHAEENI